jgi:hypothetical protein
VDPNLVGLWVSLPIIILFVVANGVNLADTLRRGLYPDTAGMRSPFYSLARFDRTRALAYLLGLLIVLGVTATAFAIAPAMTARWWFTALLAYALVLVGVPLQSLAEPSKKKPAGWDVVDAVKQLFEAGGYSVVQSPRTGREDIDPLLTNAPDLFAEAPGRRFAIAVKWRSRSGPADAAGVDELLSAAWAINKHLHEVSSTDAPEVRPLLVVVGADPSPVIRIYELNDQVRLLWVPDGKQIWDIVKTKDETSRRERATRLLASLGTGQPAAERV